MEQLDTDLDYSVSKARSDAKKRFNTLYLLPILGVLVVAFLILAVIFQLSIDTIVSSFMSLFIVLFFIVAGLMFWAMRPEKTS